MSSDPGPVAVPFDPGSGEVPPSLRPILTEPDRPLLLLVAAVADEDAARSAVALADAAAIEAGDLVLADAAVDSPRLHRLLGTPNLEGLVDVFLFGASLERVRSQPEDHAFHFVPAGAYAPEAAAVLESPRWSRVADELHRTGGRMLVFAPADTPGLRTLSRSVGAALVIGDDQQAAAAAAKLDPSCQVVGVMAPASGPGVTGSGTRTMSDAGAAAFGDRALTEPPVFRKQRESRKASPLLLVLLLVAAALAGWLLYDLYLAPGGTGLAEGPVTTRAEQPPPQRGEAMETPIPISVAVEAHQELESARARIASLRRIEPGITFYLAPVSVNEVLYYRLLAGPASDREAGMQLMQRLVDAGQKTAVDSWAVRPTELAFDLGDFDTRQEAETRVRRLAALEIPAYIVPIRHDPGAPRYRVYGGAYESQAEADIMKQMLENAGIDARLVQRTGEPIQ